MIRHGGGEVREGEERRGEERRGEERKREKEDEVRVRVRSGGSLGVEILGIIS
jgi:hypothetical protein